MTPPATVVIGAGVIGCLVARELAARDPRAAITVLDRDAVGAGASRRSAGLHLPRGGTDRVRRMAADSHAYYADLSRRSPDLPIRPVGVTVIAAGGSGSGGRAHAATPASATGRGHDRLGGYLDLAAPRPAAALDGSQPGSLITLPQGTAAWQISGSHHTDVYQFCQAIAVRLRQAVRFREGVAVTGICPGRDAVTVRTGTGEAIVADSVVLAPGPWVGSPAWRDLLAPLRLRVKKVAALHVERRPDPADKVVVFEDEDAFLLPLPGRGHWLFSYTCAEWDVDPDELTAGLSAGIVSAARDCLRRYAPGLAEHCAGGRVFCDAYSPDGEPAIRALDEAGRIIFAGAANGSGYRLAPAIAAQAADLLHRSGTEGVTGDHQHV